MTEITTSPYFGIFVTLAFFVIGHYLHSKTKFPLFNPLLFSILAIIIFLNITNIPYKNYQIGGSLFNLLITPATIALAIKLEENFIYLKKYGHFVLISIIIGILTHTIAIIGLAKLFQLDIELMASMYSKSITTAIAVEVTQVLDGILAITIISVILSGITGALVANTIFKWLKINHPVAQGIALGSASHAMGTSHAIQLGHLQGAMASLALVITGILVMLSAPLADIIIEWIF